MTTQKENEYIVRSTCKQEFMLPNVIYAKYLADKITSWDPNGIAIIDAQIGAKLTFSQLHQKAQDFASALVQLGITKRDVVCFFADNSIQFAIAMLATEYLGVTFAPLSPLCRKYDLTTIINGFGGTVLVIGSNKLEVLKQAIEDEKLVDNIKAINLFVELDESRPDEIFYDYNYFNGRKVITYKQASQIGTGRQLRKIPHFHIVEPKKEHFFYVSTSGTTGPPKKVIHTHRSFMAMVLGIGMPQCSAASPYALWVSLGQSIGTVLLNTGLLTNSTAILFKNNDLNVMMSLVEKYRIEILHFSPDLANALDKINFHEKYDFSSVRIISYGSGKIANQVLLNLRDKYKALIWNSYGSKESFGHLILDPEELENNFQPGSAGRVIPGVEMKVVDMKTRKSLAPFQQGEIYFRGPQLFAGYMDNEEATRETLDKDGWYHTGDLGYYDQSGSLFIADRLKEIIKYKIFSIVPAEIEEFLQQHEAVVAACVVGVRHPDDFNWCRAYVQLANGKSVTEQQLIQHVAENLGTQKQLLAGVKFVTEMPRTSIGKILRSHFKELVKNESIRV